MTRPPVTLSREMKILLTALGLVALLGGWLVLNNRQQADTATTPPPVTAGQPPSAANNNGTSGNTNTSGSTSGTAGSEVTAGNTGSTGSTDTTVAPPASGAQVTSDGKTEIATVPPFPVTDPNGSTPDPTVVAAVPRGINPDQPLNNLNGSNPFSPIRIEASGTTPSGALASTPPATNAGPVTITRPTTPPSQIDSALNNSGALPLPTIPGADTASRPSNSKPSTSSPSNNAGALPVPTIPGIPAGGSVTVIGASGQPSTGPSSSGKAPSTTVNVPNTPMQPPIAGVRVPSSVNVPSSSTSAATGASGNGAVNSTDLSTPPVMTELGATGDTAQTTLDSAIKEHNLVFDAAVLGPINTAVFRSDKGYVVATVGQTIPNTNITLQEVTASTATLAAGNDKKILELDKR